MYLTCSSSGLLLDVSVFTVCLAVLFNNSDSVDFTGPVSVESKISIYLLLNIHVS